MKFIKAIKQCEGPGGTLETWELDNDMILGYWKDETDYDIFLRDKLGNAYTKVIFQKLNHPYNDLEMFYGLVMPPRITLNHKYFDKFIQLVEKLSIEDLEPDDFSG